MQKTLQIFSSLEVIRLISSGHLHILSAKQKSCAGHGISYQTAVEGSDGFFLLYLKRRRH